MKSRQYEGKSLTYQVIEPDGYQPGADYPLVVILHGYASSMDDAAGLSQIIDREGYVYACPGAPIPFRVKSGRMAYGWSSPGSSPAEVEEEEVRAAENLDVWYGEVFEQYDVRPGRVLLMGFSQGGSLSLRCGLPNPSIFAGLATLSGYLPEPEALENRLPDQRDQSIFIAHGINDQYIPRQQAQDTRTFLETHGYTPQYNEYDMRHEIRQEVMEDLVPWIKTVLPPFNG